MSRALDAWDRFWFEPQSTAPVALLRIAFGIVAFLWTIGWAPDLFAFFSQGGILSQQPSYMPWGLLRWFPSDGAVLGLYVALLIASLCLIAGYRTRLAAFVVWIGVVSLTRRNPFVLNAGDYVVHDTALFLMLAPAGAAFSLDRWRTARENFWSFEVRAPWALRLAQIQLSAIYIAAVWTKLRGQMWNDGTAVSYALRVADHDRFPMPHFVSHSPLIVNLLTFGTLATEASIGIFVWNRRARPYVLGAGAMLHLFIAYTILVGTFSLAMLALYAAFIPPDRAEAVILRLRLAIGRSRLPFVRSVAAQPPGPARSDLRS